MARTGKNGFLKEVSEVGRDSLSTGFFELHRQRIQEKFVYFLTDLDFA